MTPVFDHPAAALLHMAATIPDGEALAFPSAGGRRSFAQWANEAGRLAGALGALGLGKGEPVALLAENRLEWPVVQLACALGGFLFVPLNTHYRAEDLAYAVAAAGARALLLSERFRSNAYLETVRSIRSRLPSLAHVVCLDGARDGALGYADLIAGAIAPTSHEPFADVTGPAALLYTSGTTGLPKGALLSHRGMMMCARGTAGRLAIRRGDRWTSLIPLFHCAGCILNILGCVQTGATYVGLPGFAAEELFAMIARERCTAISAVPTHYLAMLDHPARGRYDLSSLRAGTCGGADANPDVLRRCAEEFPMPGLAQVYGQTESSTLITAAAHDDPDRFATAGPPLPGYEMRIIDVATGAQCPTGAIGEVQGRGAMVMLGYHDNADATAETITPDGWLRTGDLGLVTARGRLVISGGRLKDMIIRGGENIYPVEIENLLQQHPAVAAVAVFGEPDEYYGEVVAAAVRLAAPVTAAELVAFVAERIARFKVPARFYAVEALPTTPSGKVRKVELRAMAKRGELPELHM